MASKSILGLALEGAKDLLSFTGKGTKGVYKGTSSILEMSGASKVIKAHPVRYTSVGATLLGATAAAGVAGIGPMSSLGDYYSKNMTAQYGDRPETQKTISATQTTFTLGALGLGAIGGAGLIGMGPLAANYKKMASSFGKGSSSLLKETGGLLNKVDKGAAKMLQRVGDKTVDYLNSPELVPKSTQKKVSSFAKGAIARRFSAKGSDDLGAYSSGFAIRQYPKKIASSFGKGSASWSKKPVQSVKNHPFLWGAGLGGLAGVSAAASTDQYEHLRGGKEGKIIGIDSSPQGGISPDLQFSTYDLLFALHRNNKSYRGRYQ